MQCGHRTNRGRSIQSPIPWTQTPSQKQVAFKSRAEVSDSPSVTGGINLDLALMAAMWAAIGGCNGVIIRLGWSLQLQPVRPKENGRGEALAQRHRTAQCCDWRYQERWRYQQEKRCTHSYHHHAEDLLPCARDRHGKDRHGRGGSDNEGKRNKAQLVVEGRRMT